MVRRSIQAKKTQHRRPKELAESFAREHARQEPSQSGKESGKS
jgi:hypothetical protein